jgi:hypothetical protein
MLICMASLITLHLARALVDEHQRKASLLRRRKNLSADHPQFEREVGQQHRPVRTDQDIVLQPDPAVL